MKIYLQSMRLEISFRVSANLDRFLKISYKKITFNKHNTKSTIEVA